MTWTLRLLTPVLLFTVACTVKDDGDDGSNTDSGSTTDGGTFGGSTTSGDQVTTTGIEDPTTPSGSGSATTTSAGTDPQTTTQPGTSVGTLDTGSEDVTSAGTLDTGNETDTGPIEPPVPCGDGDPVNIEANTIFAYTEAQVPPQPDPTNTGTGGDPNPAETIYIKLSDQAFTCQDPNANLECGPHWEVTLVIKPEFQFPGTYNLLDNNMIFGISGETGAPDGNPDECSFGGGSFGGTLELGTITDGTISGRLCNVDAFFFDTDPELNGGFVAERCQ